MAVDAQAFKKVNKDVTTTYLRAELEDLYNLYRDARSGNAQAIHQARVRARRWAAACKLLRNALGKKNAAGMAHQVRKLARALAGVRALDVSVQLAKERRAPAWLRQALQSLRRARWEKVKTKLDSVRLNNMRDKVSKSLLAARMQPGGAQAQASLNKTKQAWHRRCRVAMAGKTSHEKWHGLRIATKKWRYALEAAETLRLARAGTPLQPFKNLQAALGKAHDERVLLKMVKKIAFQQNPARQNSTRRNQAKILVRELDQGIRESLDQARAIVRAVRSKV